MKSTETIRHVTVRFTEAGLHDCCVHGITEGQRRLLAAILAGDPNCGSARRDIKHLRSLRWPIQKGTGRTIELTVWYLFIRGTPHVEVIAVTDTNDAPNQRISKSAIKLIAKIAIAIRVAYSAGKVVRDHWDEIIDYFT
jgi:hypothetical protein